LADGVPAEITVVVVSGLSALKSRVGQGKIRVVGSSHWFRGPDPPSAKPRPVSTAIHEVVGTSPDETSDPQALAERNFGHVGPEEAKAGAEGALQGLPGGLPQPTQRVQTNLSELWMVPEVEKMKRFVSNTHFLRFQELCPVCAVSVVKESRGHTSVLMTPDAVQVSHCAAIGKTGGGAIVSRHDGTSEIFQIQMNHR